MSSVFGFISSVLFAVSLFAQDIEPEQQQQTDALISPQDTESLHASEPTNESEDSSPQKTLEQPPATLLCEKGPRPFRAAIRHIEANGIGYKTGYTTLECFFGEDIHPFLFPFIDIRGHVFNDGRCAFNTGAGLRARQGSWIYGGNAYYDFRNTKHHTYSQIGLGFECLGITWDLRANGYIPVGPSKSSTYGPVSFGKFEGNSLFVRRKQEFAMYGVNVETAAHCKVHQDVELYPAVGPYYFGAKGKNAVGGQARLLARYKDYVALEGSFSYDSVFRDIFQGQITLSLPFGRKTSRRTASETMSCSTARLLQERNVQPVVRDEIIVVDTATKNVIATNPATGLPWAFFFVDNTSSSAGTFESPFSSLATALSAANSNDVIYIFPGDGTSKGLNVGNYSLQDGQQLLGAGIAHNILTQYGTISIPNMSSGTPLLTAPTQNSVIIIANNNTVSGLHLVCDGGSAPVASLPYCIGSPGDISVYPPVVATTLYNLNVNNNILEIFSGAYGIAPNNQGGTILISNNTISSPNNTGTTGICLSQTNVVATNTITNNQISGIRQANGLNQSSYALYSILIGSSNTTTQIKGNTVTSSLNAISYTTNNSSTSNIKISDNIFYGGINIQSFDSSHITNSIDENIITFSASDQLYTIYQSPNNTSSLCSTVTGNQFTGRRWLSEAYSSSGATYHIVSNTFNLDPGNIVNVISHDNASVCLNLVDNVSNVNYVLQALTPSIFNLEPPSGNTGTIVQIGPITSVPTNSCPTCQ